MYYPIKTKKLELVYCPICKHAFYGIFCERKRHFTCVKCGSNWLAVNIDEYQEALVILYEKKALDENTAKHLSISDLIIDELIHNEYVRRCDNGIYITQFGLDQLRSVLE